MKKIRKFLKEGAKPILFVLVGFILSITIYTAQAAWNDIVIPGEPFTATLWNDVVNKFIELDNRMNTEETAVQPACDWNGTAVIGERVVWGANCGTNCCGSDVCFGQCQIRDVFETEMTCDGTEVTGITQTAVGSGCACTAGCTAGDDITDESPEDLEFYREIVEERKALIENGKTEKTLH